MTVDTSAEAVERLTNAVLYDMQRMTPGTHNGAVVATMRALAAERDDLDHMCKLAIAQRIAAETDRDRLAAEVARLREALIRLRDCDWTIGRGDRMDPVRDIARAALTGDTP